MFPATPSLEFLGDRLFWAKPARYVQHSEPPDRLKGVLSTDDVRCGTIQSKPSLMSKMAQMLSLAESWERNGKFIAIPKKGDKGSTIREQVMQDT